MNHVSDYLPNESLQHWALGCQQCKFGIVMAPELTGACSLHLERLVQAINQQIIFCECQAGRCYRVFLLNLRQRLIEEARKDKRMIASAAVSTHPEIEWAKAKVAEKVSFVPTIHAA